MIGLVFKYVILFLISNLPNFNCINSFGYEIIRNSADNYVLSVDKDRDIEFKDKLNELNKLRIKSEIKNKRSYIIKRNVLILYIILISILMVFILYILIKQNRQKQLLLKKHKLHSENNKLQEKDLELLNEKINIEEKEIQNLQKQIETYKIASENNVKLLDEVNIALKNLLNNAEHEIISNIKINYKIYRSDESSFSNCRMMQFSRDNFIYLIFIDYIIENESDMLFVYLILMNIAAIINKMPSYTTDEVFNKLRNFLIKELDDKFRDMIEKPIESSLVKIDTIKQTLQFTGANKGIFIKQNEKTTYLKPDEMPLGHSNREGRKFSKRNNIFHKGDMMFVFDNNFVNYYKTSQNESIEKFLDTVTFENVDIKIKEFSMKKDFFLYLSVL
ncbi:MAG: hypothetical protein Kow0068_04460 [Marinilabiliales bacterium]